jgi:NitT/TauT family transport system ATP-binding protein
MTTQPIIAIDQLHKIYESGAGPVTALEHVSLDIQPGEFVSLIGPSGCGKSTLMRLIGDLTEPSSGTIQINGRTPAEARRERQYGIVFQAPVLYDWRTVQRNVELPLEVIGVERAERSRRAAELLALVGLGEFGRAYPWQLSGGMQQRVSIARALVFQPAILLMDEPFGALDEITRERMQLELLNTWARTNATVIFVTHSIPEAVFLSDRVVVMSPRPGRVSAIVPIDLPRPRDDDTRELPRFFELATRVRELLRH